ncbi:GLPGLI family protein [Bergeyella porcorum]|uniref:GLPGLI family protein n=1 Tax=Bergeyella porcorum TaxID=1735111 RepID=UPI0035E98A9A
MKKLSILFLFSLMSFMAYSQNTVRVYYQLESKTNLKPETPSMVDVYILEIDTKKQTSKFFNATYKSIDSVYSRLAELSSLNGSVSFDARKLRFPKFNIGVVDDGKGYDVFRIFDGDIYKYSEKKNTQWSIGGIAEKIDGYETKKATAKINGREWEVYFATELPLSFGPYVLGQLPGLVLLAKDRTGSYSFRMIGLEKNVEDNDFLPSPFGRAIKTTKAKYKKAFENFKKDPARKLRENIATQPDGDYMKLANPLPADYIKRKEEEWKQYYKDNDNDIDKEKF